MNLNLAGKRALVTGGMSTLGRAILHSLATEGVETLITYRDEAKGEEARELCRAVSKAYDVYCNAVCIDLRSKESIDEGIGEVKKLFPHLDIFIHNAGVFTVSSQTELTEDAWDTVMDVNIKGMWRMIQETVPLMKEREGSVVAVSSINASRPGFGGTAHYDASKGAVSSYIRSLAAELAPLNIRVNGVAPGLLASDTLEEGNPELVKSYKERSLTSSLVEVESVASTIVYLTSKAASSITGEIVTIDGGYSLT